MLKMKFLPLIVSLLIPAFCRCGSGNAAVSTTRGGGNAGVSAARSGGADDARAEAAADEALAAMSGTPPRRSAPASPAPSSPAKGSSARTTPAPPPRQATGSGGKPAWVDNPDAVYPRNAYLSAVGYAGDRNGAEKNALANLISIFGQTVQAELKTLNTYNQAVRNGAIKMSSENTTISNAINTSAQMDTLLGAEIGGTWYDGKSVYWAVAVMERNRTNALYGDLIRSNQRIITDLTSLSGSQRNSLDAYSRYMLAATIADANRVYANVLTTVGNSSGVNPSDLREGKDYRLEAANIARNIPIGVTVNGDRSDRIRGAFAAAISKAGFRSGGNNSRYVLRAALSLSPVESPSQNKFVRYVLDANLVDTAENSVLIPFNTNGREGHLNLPEAEERAVRAAEKKVNDTYAAQLADYLASLLPK